MMIAPTAFWIANDAKFLHVDNKSRVERKTGVSQMVVFPQT